MPSKKRCGVKNSTPAISFVASPEFHVFEYRDTDNNENAVNTEKRKNNRARLTTKKRKSSNKSSQKNISDEVQSKVSHLEVESIDNNPIERCCGKDIVNKDIVNKDDKRNKKNHFDGREKNKTIKVGTTFVVDADATSTLFKVGAKSSSVDTNVINASFKVGAKSSSVDANVINASFKVGAKSSSVDTNVINASFKVGGKSSSENTNAISTSFKQDCKSFIVGNNMAIMAPAADSELFNIDTETETPSTSNAIKDGCPVCNKTFLTTETTEQKTVHINRCLDDMSNNDIQNETQSDEQIAQNLQKQTIEEVLQDGSTYICTVCMKNLTSCDTRHRQMHMNQCLNKTVAFENEGRRLRKKKGKIDSSSSTQTCPMCGVKLRKEKFFPHVNKCSRSLKYSPQQLMQILQTTGISSHQLDGECSNKTKHRTKIKKKDIPPSKIVKHANQETTVEFVVNQAKSILPEKAVEEIPSTPVLRESSLGKASSPTGCRSVPNTIVMLDEKLSSVADVVAKTRSRSKLSTLKNSECKLWSLSAFDVKTQKDNFMVNTLKNKLNITDKLRHDESVHDVSRNHNTTTTDDSFTGTQYDKLDILMALTLPLEKTREENGFISDNTDEKINELQKKSHEKLLTDLNALLQSSIKSDFTFHCKDDVDVTCHKFMLMSRSEKLKEMITDGVESVEVFDLSATAVQKFLHYLYVGSVDFLDVVDEIFILANRYEIDFLTQTCIIMKPPIQKESVVNHSTTNNADDIVDTFWKQHQYEEEEGSLRNESKDDNEVGEDSSFSDDELAVIKDIFKSQVQINNNETQKCETGTSLNHSHTCASSKLFPTNILVPNSVESSPVSPINHTVISIDCSQAPPRKKMSSPMTNTTKERIYAIDLSEKVHSFPNGERSNQNNKTSSNEKDNVEEVEYTSCSATPMPLSCETPAIFNNTSIVEEDRVQEDSIPTALRELDFNDTTVVQGHDAQDISLLSPDNTVLYSTTSTSKQQIKAHSTHTDKFEPQHKRMTTEDVDIVEAGFHTTTIRRNNRIGINSNTIEFSDSSIAGNIIEKCVESPCMISRNTVVVGTPSSSLSTKIETRFEKDKESYTSKSTERKIITSVILDSSEDESEQGTYLQSAKLRNSRSAFVQKIDSPLIRTNAQVNSSAESISFDDDTYNASKQESKRKRKCLRKLNVPERRQVECTVSSDDNVSDNESLDTGKNILLGSFANSKISPARSRHGTPSQRSQKKKAYLPYSPVVNDASPWLSTSDKTCSSTKRKRNLRSKMTLKKRKEGSVEDFKNLLKSLPQDDSSSSVEFINSSSEECKIENEDMIKVCLRDGDERDDASDVVQKSASYKQYSSPEKDERLSRHETNEDDDGIAIPEDEYSIYYMDDGGYNSFMIEPCAAQPELIPTTADIDSINNTSHPENDAKVKYEGSIHSVPVDTKGGEKKQVDEVFHLEGDKIETCQGIDDNKRSNKETRLPESSREKQNEVSTMSRGRGSVQDTCDEEDNQSNNIPCDDGKNFNDSVFNVVDVDNDSFAAYCVSTKDAPTNNDTSKLRTRRRTRGAASLIGFVTSTPVSSKAKQMTDATFKTPMNSSITTETKAFGPGCDKHPETNEPITPMPDYSNFPTPQLQQEITKIALRNMAKPKMIAKMKEVYKYQHNFTNWEEECKKVKRKPRKKNEIVDTNVEDHVEEKKSKRKKVSNKRDMDDKDAPSIQEMLHNFFKSDRELRTKILSYQPLDFVDVYNVIKTNSITCSKKTLEVFLDAQCICYYTKDETTSKPRTRKRRVKKYL